MNETIKLRLHNFFTFLANKFALTEKQIEAKEIKLWENTKQSLLAEHPDIDFNQDGTENRTKRATILAILDNTYKNLYERKQYSKLEQIDTNLFYRLALNVMKNSIASDIIAVQEISGPVAPIHVLTMKQDDNGKPKLAIDKHMVETKTRKLSARWSFQISNTNTPDNIQLLNNEIENALSQEIIAEFDMALHHKLKKLAGEPSFVYSQSPEVSFVGDAHAALAILINRQANLIASRTKRGAGNWSIVSPTALTILQSATTSAFSKREEKSGANYLPDIRCIRYAGRLQNIKIYVCGYLTDNEPVLTGYHGNNNCDSSMILAPYLPVLSTGLSINPETFEPMMSFMTRYGAYVPTNEHGLSNHLSLVGIDTKNLSFV